MNRSAKFSLFRPPIMRTPTSSKPGTQAHILLVDDNRMGLSARKIVLEELGYQITAMNNSQEALEHFPKHNFDLVVTDYRMPNMDGIELIANMRQTKPELPIILISGFADTLGLDEKTTGADIVIQKSNHEVSNLVRSVQRLLNRQSRKPAGKQVKRLKSKSHAV